MPECCMHQMYTWKNRVEDGDNWKRVKVCLNPKCEAEIEVIYTPKEKEYERKKKADEEDKEENN